MLRSEGTTFFYQAVCSDSLITTLYNLALGNKIYTLSLTVGQRPTQMGLESPRKKNPLTC